MNTNPVHLKNYDPLTDFLRYRLKLTPARFGIVVLVINLVVNFFAAAVFGALNSMPGRPSLIEDIVAAYADYVLCPVIAVYYLWTTQAAQSLAVRLRESEVLTDGNVYAATLEKSSRRFGSRLILGLAVVVGAAITLLLMGIYFRWHTLAAPAGWLTRSSFLPWFRMPIWFLTYYALTFAVCNVVLTVLFLRDTFREQIIRVVAWCLDESSGLGFIGRYSMNLGYGVAAVGVSLSIITVQQSNLRPLSTLWLLVPAITAYVVAAPLLFYAPLASAHSAMKKARLSQLRPISEKLNAAYEQLMGHLDGQPDTLKAIEDRMRQLEYAYEVGRRLPAWPLNATNIRRFLGVTGAAILPAIATVVADAVASVLGI